MQSVRLRSASLPNPVLATRVTVDYPQKKAVLRDLAIDVHPGEILGLAGQSGAGKSTLALALFRLLQHTGAKITGSIQLEGEELLDKDEQQMRAIRGRRMSLIPQSPLSALNPALRLGTQLREAWKAHASDPAALPDRVRPLLSAAALPSDELFLRRYPSQMSVGQAQRFLIVMALLHNPALVIADEPSSALDVMTHRDVLSLLRTFNQEGGAGFLYISHDLPSIRTICHRIAILHEGAIVESGPVDEVLGNPRHPYTKNIVEAVPKWL